jgi:hypothetical protein
MELKIGDKVRFLDAIGGGTVMAFQGKDMVIVLEEDGFETPVFIRKCVVIETAAPDPKPSSSDHKRSTPAAAEPKPITPSPQTPKPVSVRQPESREGEILNVSLAYLVAEGHTFQEAVFECYLINESNYALMFNYASCSGKTWTSRCAGTIEANSKLFLEEFTREAIPELEKICLQVLAYKPGGFYTFKHALSAEIRLDIVKFYKVHCFHENDFFEEDALVVSVVKNDLPERALLTDPEIIRTAMLEKKSERPRVFETLNRKPRLLEVDLHINSLLDSTAGMDAKAMLDYQLEVFRKTLDENRKLKGMKIVFIHGKGDGILRAAILNELKTKYKTFRYQDASFQEYGFGATQVTIG